VAEWKHVFWCLFHYSLTLILKSGLYPRPVREGFLWVSDRIFLPLEEERESYWVPCFPERGALIVLLLAACWCMPHHIQLCKLHSPMIHPMSWFLTYFPDSHGISSSGSCTCTPILVCFSTGPPPVT
jgi:hypothetical protein